MVQKAERYKRMLLCKLRTVPDSVAVCRALWESVAVPSILYGSEALVVEDAAIEELDKIQRQYGKMLLGLNESTANEVVEMELGMKPFRMRFALRKVSYFKRHMEGEFECGVVKVCLEELMARPDGMFMKGIRSLLAPYGFELDSMPVNPEMRIEEVELGRLYRALSEKQSLCLMPAPVGLWRVKEYIRDWSWSRIITAFRAGNAGLGNRDGHYRNMAVFMENGRIVACPLCNGQPYNEVHVLAQCVELERARRDIRVDGMTLRGKLERYRRELGETDDVEICRYFVGQDLDLSIKDMKEHGSALLELMDAFFLSWAGRWTRR